jgi:F-type H+-transporting ATPase subunit epsilon
MSDTRISFELVSPEEKLVSEDVYMAVIPGDEGQFGVMAGHCSLVSSLRPGVVKLFAEEGAKPRHIFITGGFADVSGGLCTVLAEHAINVQDLSKATLEQDLSNLNEDLGMAEEDADKKRVQGKIAITKAKLDAVAAAA